MIGLVEIAKVFNMQYKEIGERIGVSAQTIQDWVKERRKIPSKRLQQLSDLFNLREVYFTKELSELEIMEVQMQYLHSLAKKVETPLFDEDGNQIGFKKENENQSELNFMQQKNDVLKKKDTIRNELEKLFESDELCEEEPVDFNSSNLEALFKFFKLMKNEGTRNQLKIILFLLHHTDDFDDVNFDIINKKYTEFAIEFNEVLEKYKTK